MRKLTTVYLIIGIAVTASYFLALHDVISVEKDFGVIVQGINFTSFILETFIAATAGIAAYWVAFYEHCENNYRRKKTSVAE